VNKIKFILTAIILCLTLSVYGQDSTGVFAEIFQTTESKDNNYNNTILWVAESFNDSNKVFKLKEREAGLIVIKGAIHSDGFLTSFTMSIKITESEYSVTIKNWTNEEYKYTYGNISDCYTKRCRKNYKKWVLSVKSLGKSLLQVLKPKI